MRPQENNPLDLVRLKELIKNGLTALPNDTVNNSAVMVIGDTGVGKSTIMSFLAGAQLVIKHQGLKATLDNDSNNLIKIGHKKYSETSIPTKVVIDKMAFYDCPGFRDNKGQEFEISNSFFVQRLLDIYERVKITLIIDQSHISQPRADKLPKLIRNLHTAFQGLTEIQDGVCIIVNRAAPDLTLQDYHKEIKQMINMKQQNISLFNEDQRKFLQFLMFRKRILLFRQASKDDRDNAFKPTLNQNSILRTIKECQYVKSKHIQNILSQSAKLAIRDYIDEITSRSNIKIQRICSEIVLLYSNKVQSLGRNITGIIALKDTIIHLAEEIKKTDKHLIIKILQRELPQDKIEDFEEDFASILFFKNIYDKTATYFSNLINKIYSQLSGLLTKVDKRIIVIQREEEEFKRKRIEETEQEQKREVRKKEESVAVQSYSKMNDIKILVENLIYSQGTLIERIKASIKSLGEFEGEIRKTRVETDQLSRTCKEVSYEFQEIQVTYFDSRKSER